MDNIRRRSSLLSLSSKEIAAYLFVFVAYFLSAKLGLYLYYEFETSPALIWPPVGIALAAVIFGGYRMWAPILLAQFLALVTQSPGTYQIAFIIAVAYAIQAAVGLYVLRQFAFEPSFDKLRNTLILVGVAFSVTLIEPIIATVAQAYLYSLSVSPWVNLGRAWGAGVFSVLVLTPFILMWYQRNRTTVPTSSNVRIEILAAFGVLLAENYFLFWTPYPQYFGISVIFFLPAVLIWFSLRLHPRWLALALVVTSIQGIAGSILAHPSAIALNEQLLADEVYIGLVAAIFLVFVSVVEERRMAFRRLESAYLSTSAADQAKSEFIAILAHELRNPLAPIVSSLELLRLQPQTSESIQSITNAEAHVSMIRRLLDDLLDTVRLTQNKFNLQKEMLSLQEIIARSVESVRDFVRSRDHDLRISLPDEDIMLHADPVRIQQIVINLLNNAVKYTDPGGDIELKVEEQNGNAVIRVTDNGIGIEPDKHTSIFEAFKQVKSSTPHGTGLGIGLFLTKQLVGMHGGRIEAASLGLGRGSVFTVYLPLPSQKRLAEVSAHMKGTPTIEKTRILIVDDNRAAADGIQKLLTHRGHEVETAYSGKHALETSESFAPDVILLDIGLPDLDGYEVARQLRSSGWSGKIIALTGYGQESDLSRSKLAGFDRHLVKPVGVDDIVTILAQSHSMSRAV